MANKNQVMQMVKDAVKFENDKMTIDNVQWLAIVIGGLPQTSQFDSTATLVDVATYLMDIGAIAESNVAYIKETDATSAKNAMLALLSEKGNDFRAVMPESHNVLVNGNANTIGIEQMPTLYHLIVGLDIGNADNVADAIEKFVANAFPATGANIVVWSDVAKALRSLMLNCEGSKWASEQIKSDNGYTAGYDLHHADGRKLVLRYNGRKPTTIVRTK